MGAEKRLLPIKEAFQLAQQPHQNQAKLVVALSRTYRTTEDKVSFHEEFVHHLKYAMVVYKREPVVERVIEFAAKFVTSFHQSDVEDDEEEDTGLLNYLCTFLLKSHEANSNAVRFRVCQLINKLLGNMPENAQIDDDLFDKINEAMLIRLKDKIPNVRLQAVLALSRLQDPKDDECPVANAYATLIENDSNPEVRRAVLSCIVPSAKTLSKIVGRTKDVKEAVRKLAYQVLGEKVHMRAMSIAQRVMLLQQGLNDRSEAVKQATQKHLLQGWLRFAEGNVLELLHRLDVENSSEVAVSVLNSLFSVTPLNELAEICKHNDNRKLIPMETLTPENALYWRALCEYLKSKGDEGEEFLEQILPEPVIYAEYLLSYIQSIPIVDDGHRNDFSYIGHLMTKEFIGQQLILIIKSLDTSEEGGRKRLLAILQEILTLPTTPMSLISFLVERLLHIITDDNKRTQIVTEIISEIRAPIVTVGAEIDPADARKKELKMAEIKVKLIEAKEALQNCITLQDFNRASELKEEIKALEDARVSLLKETEQLEIKEVHVEKNDAETLQKCLILCYELLKQISTSAGISATMNGIIDSLILPGIISVHPVVRNLAVLCLGCCGLQNQNFASKHFVLLLQVLQIDDVTIKMSALKAIFDQLMTFGIEPFTTQKAKAVRNEGAEINTSEEQESEEAGEVTGTAKNVLKLLSDFLDSEVSELRTGAAEGLAKLMFSGLLVSSRILSRLILLWYNPVTEDDVRLRHCLGVFFPMFAYASRTNQECFEEAFFPALRTLANAPASSPLAEVDISNVAELLVDLTRPSALHPQAKNSQDYQALTVHDNLAIKICNEILTCPCSPEIRVYTKALSSLELSTNLAKDLLVLLNEILEQVKDRICLRALEKIKSQLQKGNKDGGDQAAAAQDAAGMTTVCENEEKNKEVYITPPKVKATRASKSTQRKTDRGRRKVTASARMSRRRQTSGTDLESDHEVPEPESEMKVRLPRRAKTAALAKSKRNLEQLLNEEMN
ncbi:PREDICTED: condensin complex subunit 3 isoform X1 [Miniopterus natalensis]|uniref:condensin complex subunit 3 isoform X1 n=1 Tax=Miniopterus natalensis TaxID=291302 RepID=UPI0007A6FDF5|nr:PREDICTED: condensin complex subunit 3 isoform X1 [Miniopterus natalensis]XP_016055238.1 PREDICTED: condensin complex subunit 3 isoform X1 [Miniopterus natalensis]XP_016055239.1 PREDICTED: condensin complex subunit 3 isoform X1 [Miniopterus natalensis]